MIITVTTSVPVKPFSHKSAAPNEKGDKDRGDRGRSADNRLRERPVESVGCLRIHVITRSLVTCSMDRSR